MDESDFDADSNDDWSDTSHRIWKEMADNLPAPAVSTQKTLLLSALQRIKVWLVENCPIGEGPDVVVEILYKDNNINQ